MNDSNGKDVFPTNTLHYICYRASTSQPHCSMFYHILGVTIKGPSLVQSKYVILIPLNFHFVQSA